MTEISIAQIENSVRCNEERVRRIPSLVAEGHNVLDRDYTKADVAERALRDLIDYDDVTDLDLSRAVEIADGTRKSAAAIAVYAARHLANVMCTGLDRVTEN